MYMVFKDKKGNGNILKEIGGKISFLDKGSKYKKVFDSLGEGTKIPKNVFKVVKEFEKFKILDLDSNKIVTSSDVLNNEEKFEFIGSGKIKHITFKYVDSKIDVDGFKVVDTYKPEEEIIDNSCAFKITTEIAQTIINNKIEELKKNGYEVVGIEANNMEEIDFHKYVGGTSVSTRFKGGKVFALVVKESDYYGEYSKIESRIWTNTPLELFHKLLDEKSEEFILKELGLYKKVGDGAYYTTMFIGESDDGYRGSRNIEKKVPIVDIVKALNKDGYEKRISELEGKKASLIQKILIADFIID